MSFGLCASLSFMVYSAVVSHFQHSYSFLSLIFNELCSQNTVPPSVPFTRSCSSLESTHNFASYASKPSVTNPVSISLLT